MDARSQIECSFRELLETQPYGKITVQDICDRAKVSRKTFYTHFHDKEDVACGYFTRMTVEPIRKLNDILVFMGPDKKYEVICEHLYQSMLPDKDYYLRLIGDGLGDSSGVFVRSVTNAISKLNMELLENGTFDERIVRADHNIFDVFGLCKTNQLARRLSKKTLWLLYIKLYCFLTCHIACVCNIVSNI